VRAGESVRLLLVLLLGLLGGSELRRHYASAPAAAVATPPATAPTAEKSTPPATPDEDDTGAGNAAEPSFDAEMVMYDQPHQMEQALTRLKPQTPGKTDLYFLAFGGDGGQDVFRNEAEYAERLMATRFDAAGHTLSLINNPDTVDTHPLATWSNLEIALTGLEKTMDPTEDILVLFLTSHGDTDHTLLVDLDPLPLDQIGADDLAEILSKHAFRWKVVIVSACYSGGFVAPLKNATTMVITASRADRSSFGCGTDSDITYFGKAFFAEGLNQSDSFTGAFGIAKNLVDEWETQDKETHSEPQIATTTLIESKLRAWREGIHLGPALPFVAPDETLTAKR
jgi:hypothetical protein